MAYATADAQGVCFVDWSIRRLAFGRYDLVHLNWPESRWTRRGRVLSTFGAIELISGVLFATVRRRPVVLTAHNLTPHENPHPFVHWAAMRILRRRVRGAVALDETHVSEIESAFPAASVAIAPMGTYEWAEPLDARLALAGPRRRPLVLAHGLQRAYKGSSALVAASRELGGKTHDLVIAGEFDGPVLETCRAEAARSDHIQLRNWRQTREELAELHSEASVVVVPFVHIDNTSSLLLSLCFNVPVAAPRLPAILRMQEIVGVEWVYAWEGRLSPRLLSEIVKWSTLPRDVSPRLEHFSWDRHRAVVAELYQELVR